MAVSLRLKELRLQAGATQTELARLLGVSREAYSMYESGKRQPGLAALDTLAAYYRVTVDYLLGRTDCPDAEPLAPGARCPASRNWKPSCKKTRNEASFRVFLTAACRSGDKNWLPRARGAGRA